MGGAARCRYFVVAWRLNYDSRSLKQRHAADVVSTPGACRRILIRASQAHHDFAFGVPCAQVRAHLLDNGKAAAPRERQPRIVKRCGQWIRCTIELHLWCALHHSHRRKHSPRKTLVVWVAALPVVVKWQQQLGKQHDKNEAAAP